MLIVEDDFFIATDLQATLADAGAQIAGPCGSVEDALSRVADGGVTAAILDLRLSGESIEPVARRLSERGIPFVFYTGQGGSDPVTQNWPGRQIIPKPARPGVLVGAIARLLS